MTMVSRDEVMALLSEGSTPILELSEIRQLCRARGLDDSSLEVRSILVYMHVDC